MRSSREARAFARAHRADESDHLVSHGDEYVPEFRELRQSITKMNQVDERRSREHVVNDVVEFLGERVNVFTVVGCNEAGVQPAMEVASDFVTSSFEALDLVVVFVEVTQRSGELAQLIRAVAGVCCRGFEQLEEAVVGRHESETCEPTEHAPNAAALLSWGRKQSAR